MTNSPMFLAIILKTKKKKTAAVLFGGKASVAVGSVFFIRTARWAVRSGPVSTMFFICQREHMSGINLIQIRNVQVTANGAVFLMHTSA